MIYSPVLKSSQAPFLSSASKYSIYYSIQQIDSISEIKNVCARVVRQSDNKNMVETSVVHPDGLLYYAFDSQNKFIDIFKSDLIEPWGNGTLFKVQLRFGNQNLPSDTSNFANWLQSNQFSEWSNVMLIKSIDNAVVEIQNANSMVQDVVSSEKTEYSLTPLFFGYAKIDTEIIDQFKFDLYNDNVLIDTSNWLQSKTINNVNEYRFNRILIENEKYEVEYSVRTVNGYEQASKRYKFIAVETALGELNTMEFSVKNNVANGSFDIYISAKEGEALTGNYVICRTDEKSNFLVWEDLKYFTQLYDTPVDQLIYSDCTIESGVCYEYGVAFENKAGLRTSMLREPGLPVHKMSLEGAYLVGNETQIRLQFNNTVQSFKHTVLRNKQDTLGGKYPYLSQNGNAYYAEFPIGGLITLHSEDEESTETRQGCGSPVSEIAETGCRDFNLTAENIYAERKYREKVEAFLNDFSPKLYRSPTEGNIIVGLMNVSLTPQTTLGRMLYSFTATAYETMENTLNNLNQANIINIGSYTDEIYSEEWQDWNQVVIEDISQQVDIYELIKNKETNNHIKLVRLDEIEIEIQSDSSIVSQLQINGTNVYIPSNKKYVLKEEINSLKLVYAPEAVIVNYKCSLQRVYEEEITRIVAIDTSLIWGQIEEQSYIPTENDPINIYSLVEEETFKQLKNNYGIEATQEADKEGLYSLANGQKIRLLIDSVDDIEIESDEATPFSFNGETLYIGQTNSATQQAARNIYKFSPKETGVTSVLLTSPARLLINYRCTTNQLIIEGGSNV